MNEKSLKLLIAGGGTGGHLFPGIAIAQAFMTRNNANQVLFVGTGKQFEQENIAKAGFSYRQITAAGIKGLGILKKLKAVAKVPVGLMQSLKILLEFKPDIVLGVGSYVSGPIILAAWMMKIPVVLQEQNIIPGLTNKMLLRFAIRIYVSFNLIYGLESEKIYVSGNPIRKQILCPETDSLHASDKISNPDPKFTVFIIGGSQGAHAVNKAVSDALNFLKNLNQYRFIHQTGEKDLESVKNTYIAHQADAIVKSFFDDMGSLYHQADLLVCRAGATTVAEVMAVGKAVIFIPYPFAADNHQVKNAEYMVEADAAEMILESELTGQKLAQKIDDYASHPAALADMALAARRLGRPHAADDIVQDWYQTILSGN